MSLPAFPCRSCASSRPVLPAGPGWLVPPVRRLGVLLQSWAGVDPHRTQLSRGLAGPELEPLEQAHELGSAPTVSCQRAGVQLVAGRPANNSVAALALGSYCSQVEVPLGAAQRRVRLPVRQVAMQAAFRQPEFAFPSVGRHPIGKLPLNRSCPVLSLPYLRVPRVAPALVGTFVRRPGHEPVRTVEPTAPSLQRQGFAASRRARCRCT